eukprot:CAMPEP_0119410762 /NCGR_PEP_ID=MMETSP1335-20130426/3690_1 /TAXON_ID=259385 /ORGANISM="Chrysoculter rhomboideus, Strain RCC1486" /LENGTH=231 /DNA_ID=CAMNT_0007435339 /DNA_START=1 /DNA_END=696 /DNA_ORIENTATION=-
MEFNSPESGGKGASKRTCSQSVVGATLMVGGVAILLVGVIATRAAEPARVGARPRIMRGDEALMAAGKHGTCVAPVQSSLRWGCSVQTSDQICCFNRHFAEYAGYWETTSFVKEANQERTVFRDPVTGLPLFVAPIGRSWQAFLDESKRHGWPSFRTAEVVWDNVRVLGNGETVSVNGTHLGHNLPDAKGARFCINLVSIAGHALDGHDDDDPPPGFGMESDSESEPTEVA